MLLSLSIRDFVLVDRIDLECEAGFTALTGETGAGKSILLDALGLALGDRAEAGVVREGCEKAEVTAVFSLDDVPDAAAWLTENGLDDPDGACILRRGLETGGRARAYINGRPATLAQLKELGEQLIDIHGQHAHYALLRPGAQRQILDAFAETQPMARDFSAAYRAWQKALRSLEAAEGHVAEAEAERERLQWQVDELSALAFTTEGWLALQDEHHRLAHAADLLQGAQATVAQLEEDESGLLARLGAAQSRVAELAAIDAGLSEVANLLEGSRVQAQEAARELSRYADHLDLDPAALAEAERRIAQVTDAARKYRLAPEALPAVLETGRARLEELNRLADPEGLRREVEALEAVYRKQASALSSKRKSAGKKLGKAVSEAMQRLSMQGGRFEVALLPCEPEAGGLESVEFQVAPNAGQGLKPLAKTASGGELSRIGLALQTILSGVSGAATLIFDEVDAGIGGGVAEIVGRMLAELGQTRQVLCVTHLPQVAATARQHWRISKAGKAGKTVSRVDVLDAAGRVEEIARMLGGVKLTETTRQHARELLGAA